MAWGISIPASQIQHVCSAGYMYQSNCNLAFLTPARVNDTIPPLCCHGLKWRGPLKLCRVGYVEMQLVISTKGISEERWYANRWSVVSGQSPAVPIAHMSSIGQSKAVALPYRDPWPALCAECLAVIM